MEGNVIFKTAFRGFDKKEVMAYIAEICEINAVNVDALERVTTDAKRLLDEVEALRIVNERLADENAELTNSLSDANNKIDELNNEVTGLNSEIAGLNNEVADLNNEVAKLNSEVSGLNNELSELNDRASKVDDIEGAEEKANKLMMDSLRYSESCIKNARKVTASINMSTKKKINKAKDCLNTVSGDFKSLTDQIELSISEISERLANLSDGLEDI